jgi:hypothetical protein
VERETLAANLCLARHGTAPWLLNARSTQRCAGLKNPAPKYFKSLWNDRGISFRLW